uniref:Uncharacterized protein n=1 Tax=Eutreptiella gymnastica TaxID=73025 RepID=A0A7S4CAK6_9EUGL
MPNFDGESAALEPRNKAGAHTLGRRCPQSPKKMDATPSRRGLCASPRLRNRIAKGRPMGPHLRHANLARPGHRDQMHDKNAWPFASTGPSSLQDCTLETGNVLTPAGHIHAPLVPSRADRSPHTGGVILIELKANCRPTRVRWQCLSGKELLLSAIRCRGYLLDRRARVCTARFGPARHKRVLGMPHDSETAVPQVASTPPAPLRCWHQQLFRPSPGYPS